MKITNSQLKQIIKEELGVITQEKALTEGKFDYSVPEQILLNLKALVGNLLVMAETNDERIVKYIKEEVPLIIKEANALLASVESYRFKPRG
jgi:hypothetical protein